MDEDEIALLFRLGLGPWTTPLMGKVPVLDAWPSLPAATEADVRDWREIGYDLGFRTGARSGLIVIDDDQAKHDVPQAKRFTPPPTDLISESPTGGRHYFYRAPTPCPGNSASKLAPYVDVRGSGGQVVIPPSAHATKLLPYRWVATGEPGTLPAEVLAILQPAPRVVDLTAPAPVGNGYAASALARESQAVRQATEGTRNDTLNKAAFSLGQLVAGGALSGDEVRAELTSAALACGLSDSEAATTIRSGLTGGAKHPRSAPLHPRASQAATPTHPPRESPDVLVPGSHLLPGGEYVEQGHHTFASQVLARLAPGAIYRRAAQLGEINDDGFAPVNTNRLRTIIDESVRLTAGKEGEEEPIIVFRACSHDQADVVLHFGAVKGQVRDLVHIASHPVCVGASFDLARAGWNAAHGVYLTCDSVPAPLPLDESCAVLEDLVADFPFASVADRANFFGLLLTPILRPALNEPVPMHLIGSPMERTGKTKLAEIVLGVAITGRRTPAMQLGEREEEREKRILSVLLRGQGLLHLDNLRDFIDSPALASLLTSSVYQGRLLGQSSAPTIPNGLTVVGTGNNVHATGEIAKRIVPIRLMPATDAPESRTDFRHPDLYGYVAAERPRIQAALLGLVAAWRDAGRPLAKQGFGGFERWTAVIGGLMAVAGYPEWLTNMDDWRSTADETGEETDAFVGAWHGRYGAGWVDASALFALAVEMDLFGWLDKAKSERAQRTTFGLRVLNRLRGRVVLASSCQYRVVLDDVGRKRRAKLDEVHT